MKKERLTNRSSWVNWIAVLKSLGYRGAAEISEPHVYPCAVAWDYKLPVLSDDDAPVYSSDLLAYAIVAYVYVYSTDVI